MILALAVGGAVLVLGSEVVAGPASMATVVQTHTTVEIGSTPVGAEVVDPDGVLLGQTPISVVIRFGEPLQVEVRADRHRTRRVWLTGDRPQRVIVLDPE